MSLTTTTAQDISSLRDSFNSLNKDVSKLLGEMNQSLQDAKRTISEICKDQTTASEQQDDRVRIIGTFRSCFLTKNGTPRQPSICPYARGSLKISCFNNPQHSLQNLHQFSHVWLLFLFHENGKFKFKAKVSPPRLNGEKAGIFATRSPHRPNNIGMSLVKLDSIDGGTLHVSGIDLIDGTPVIDIKPYIAEYDRPKVDSHCPPWISNPPSKPLTVYFSTNAEQQMSALSYSDANCSRKRKSSMRFMQNENELRGSIADIISADPRSVYRKKTGDLVFSFPIDAVDVKVEIKAEAVTVLDICQTEFVHNILKRNCKHDSKL